MRRSVEPPVCGNCRVTMVWFNTVRTPNTTDHLTHSFRCPSCNRTQDVTVTQSIDVSLADDPNHWCKRAAEIRELAEKMTDPKDREALLKLAADYDKLSQRAADRAQKPNWS